MALLLTMETPIGLVAENAYLRVEGMGLTHDTATFRLRGYVSSEEGLPAFYDEGFSCAYDMEGANPFTQAYAHVSGLEQFSAAVDA